MKYYGIVAFLSLFMLILLNLFRQEKVKCQFCGLADFSWKYFYIDGKLSHLLFGFISFEQGPVLFLEYVYHCCGTRGFICFCNWSSIYLKGLTPTRLLTRLFLTLIASFQRNSANGSTVSSAKPCAIRRLEVIACKQFSNVTCVMCRFVGGTETVSFCFIKKFLDSCDVAMRFMMSDQGN